MADEHGNGFNLVETMPTEGERTRNQDPIELAKLKKILKQTKKKAGNR